MNRLLNFIIFLVSVTSVLSEIPPDYEVPQPKIEVFSPRGFKLSIPHEDGVTLFAVHININKPMKHLDAGEIAVDITKRMGDFWVYENEKLRLRPGDKLYFWLYVIFEKLGYRLDDQEYTVPGGLSSTSTTKAPGTSKEKPTRIGPNKQDKCDLGYTTVSGKEICKGTVIFFEQFQNSVGWGSSNNWTSEVEIPGSPESYFMVLDKHNRMVENGFLVIEPTLLEQTYGESFVRTGHLKLRGCTSESKLECETTGFSWNIVPPILSSRLNTKNSFSFRYGAVEIRAKLPKGDWIVPEIWLVGKNYGPNSGRIVLAKSFGNDNLKVNGKNIGGHLLNQGIATNETNTLMYSKTSNTLWSNDFHNYQIEWTPGYIKFKVDNTEVGIVEPKEKLFKDIGDSYFAPFDSEFYISLGVHVGGLVDFPDDSVNGGKPKPWLNEELRNALKFWLDKGKWYPTWGEHSRLMVDYIKVTAY